LKIIEIDLSRGAPKLPKLPSMQQATRAQRQRCLDSSCPGQVPLVQQPGACWPQVVVNAAEQMVLPLLGLVALLLLLPASVVSPSPLGPRTYYWNVLAPHNSTEIEAAIAQSVGPSIVFGQVILLGEHFGLFPCLHCSSADAATGLIDRHGGIPQRANLSAHLAAVRQQLDDPADRGYVPHNFTGHIVLDYEAWRANWGWTSPTYREASLNYTNSTTPGLNATALTRLATAQYNSSAMAFLIATLREISGARPHIKGLGMYGYPLGLYYPFGFGNSSSTDCHHPQCGASQREQDDAMLPLFRQMTALHPSLYLPHPSDWNATDARHNREFIEGVVAESFRVASAVGLPASAVVPYTWYRYHEGPRSDLSSLKLLNRSDAELEFTLPSRGPAHRVESFLIYGAEDDNGTVLPPPHALPHPYSVENMIAWFKSNAYIFR
jgi:hypothetical protein